MSSSFAQIQGFASVLIAMPLLLAPCSRNVDSETVAYEFVRLYFVEDNLVEAVKLAGGSASAKLEGSLQEIEAMGAGEPAADEPRSQCATDDTQHLAHDRCSPGEQEAQRRRHL
jgi:hypothetical protein